MKSVYYHSAFEFVVRLPACDPGVLSYELSVTGDLAAANVGNEWEPELVLRDETGTYVDDGFVTYLDGTLGSNPAAGTSDYNQFVYVGEDAILDWTLLYLADWPALNEYFERTDEHAGDGRFLTRTSRIHTADTG